MNQLTMLANLTRDPELRYLPKGTAVCQIGVACNRRWKTEGGEEREDVLFLDVKAWGKQAETVAKYFRKGKQILFTARLVQETWDDKTTGAKRSKILAVLESFTFVGPSDKTGAGAGESGNGRAGESATAQAPARGPNGNPAVIDQDDVPF